MSHDVTERVPELFPVLGGGGRASGAEVHGAGEADLVVLAPPAPLLRIHTGKAMGRVIPIKTREGDRERIDIAVHATLCCTNY